MFSRLTIVLVIACIASFMAPFDVSIVNLALPDIAGSLHAQLSDLTWIQTAYLLVIASLQTTLGRVGDLKGRKRIFILGLSLFTLGSALAGVSPNVEFLILNRVVQGTGAAIMSATVSAIVVDAFPENERGRALGITTATVYSGLTLGPLGGGVLVQTLGWRSIFYVNIPIGIISVILVAFYIPKDRVTNVGKRFDLLGSISLIAFLVTLMLILSQGDLALSLTYVIILGIASFGSIVGFILIESRFAKAPIVDLRLFTHNRLFTAGNVAALFNYSSSVGTTLVVSLYLQLINGYSPIHAGLILLAQPALMVLTAPVSGRLSDRMNPAILSSIGMFSKTVGFFMLSLLGVNSPDQNVWIPLMLLGFGQGFFSSPNTNSVMSSVPANQRGFASGTMGTVRSIGQTFGIVVTVAIVAAGMPVGGFAQITKSGAISGTLPSLFVAGMSRALLLASGLCALGGFMSLVRGEKESRTQTKIP